MYLKTFGFLVVNACAYCYLINSVFNLILFLSINNSGYLNGNQIDKHDSKLALIWNIFYVFMFMFSHTILSKEGIKKLVVNLNLGPLYRTLYICVTSATLQEIVNNWTVITPTQLPLVWDKKEHDMFVGTCQVIHLVGWLMTILGIFVLDFSELIGCKQIWNIQSCPTNPMPDKSECAKHFFSNMRHPVISGFLLVLWVVPCMTIDRFLLASTFTLYLLHSSRLTMKDYDYLKKMHERKQYSLQQMGNKGANF